MAKYYITNENSWENEKNKQEKIGQGIDLLYKIDKWIDSAFDCLEYDKYGLMSRETYSSIRSKIQECDEKNNRLYNYSKSIHGIVADKDFEFFKELNKAYEELSLLDIKEYTTKNTLDITEKKTIPIPYYSGGIAYQSGTVTSYETRDLLKGKINIYDIQMKCDMFRIEEQLKAYLDTSGEKLSDKEIKEAKANFYKGMLYTSFDHEAYANVFLKGLSTTLDFIPVVGGVKNVIEGCTGYTMTGEKLIGSERATYAVLGTLSTTLDLVTFGTASGLIQGGKYVGKEAVKVSIKQATKVAIQQTTGSVVMGWTSQFASEKLRDMGLSSEEIFALHILVGVTTVGVSKFANKGISKSDKLKISSWKYAPDEELYLKYKDVFDESKYYNQITGEINWPGQHGDKNIDGFLNGKFDEIILKPGEKIDRYGSDYGSFVSPEGIPYEQRSLAPGTDLKQYSVFEVIRPIKVKAGEIAPWFNEIGGGIQYMLPDTIDELLDEEIIRRVK